MSDETDTTSEVARVLIEHIRIGAPGHGDCSCGHVVPLGHSFAAHQAAMLAEAGLLRDERATADLGQSIIALLDEVRQLQAQIAASVPAGATQGASGGSRASGGLDGAPVDAWPFQRGAVLEWPEDPQTVVDALEEAPEGVHVIDRFRNPWRRFSKGWASPKSTSDGSAAPSSYLAGRAPITVTALADTEIEP